MGGAAYPDDWDGCLHEGRNPNSRVHPQGVSSQARADGIRAGVSQPPCFDQGAHCRPLDPASLSLLP